MTLPPRWAGPAALALAIVLLGSNWPVMKLALRDSSPLWMATVRLALAGLLYVPLLAARGELAWPAQRDWGVIAILGVCQGALLTGLVTVGVGIVGAGRSAILAYTMPLMMIPGAVLLLHERVARRQWIGMGFGLAGVMVLFNPLSFHWEDRHVLLGNACVLAAAAAWSVALLTTRRHQWRASPLRTMPFQMLVGAALLAPAAMLFENAAPHVDWSPAFLMQLAYIGGGATCVAYWMIVEAARRMPAAQLSLGQLATPVLGVAASAWWAHETPGWVNLAGLALIVAGVGVSAGAKAG